MSADIQHLVHQLGGRSKPLAQLKAAKDLIVLCDGGDSINRAAAVAAGAVPPLTKLLGSTSVTIQEQAAQALRAVSNSTATAADVGAAGAIPPLLKLLGSPSAAVQTAAIDALSILMAYGGAGTQARVASAGAIPPLLQLLGSPSVEVRVNAVRALAGACGDDRDSRASMVEAGAIPLMVRLLGSEVLPEQHLLQKLVRELCASPGNVQQLVQAGVIPALVKVLRGSSYHAPGTEAAAALAAVCMNNEGNKAQAVAAGAISALVPLLQSPQGPVALAVLCTEETSAAGMNDSELVCAGAIPSLIQLLGCDLEGVQLQAAEALYSLCCNKDTMHKAVAAGAIPALVQLLCCSCGQVKEAAALVLASMCHRSEAAAAQAAAAGAIPALVQLLAPGLDTMRDKAAVALGSLCSNSTARQAAMIRAGAVGPLLQLMPVTTTCSVPATNALVSIQMDDADNQLALASTGAIPLLVQQLGSGEGMGQLLALGMLRTMFTNTADARVAAAVQGDIPALKALLDSPAVEVKEMAAAVALVAVLIGASFMGQQLDGLVHAETGGAGQSGSADVAARQSASAALHNELQEAMRRLMDLFQGLFQLAADAAAQQRALLGSSGEQAGGAAFLDKLREVTLLWAEAVQQERVLLPPEHLQRLTPEHAAALGLTVRLVVASGMLLLSALATSSVDPPAFATVRTIAAKAFRDILFFDQHGTSKFAYPDSIHVLLPMLEAGIVVGQQLVSEGILGFSTSAAQRGRLLAARAIPVLVQQLGSHCGEIQKSVVAAVCNLSVDAEGQVEVAAAAGALPALVQLLGCSCEEVQYNAALTLMNISSNAGTKAMVASAGAVPALVRLLGSASDAVQGQAAGALAGISHNADEQVMQEVASGDAIPALIQLLGSSSVAVQQQAAEALMNITTDQLNRPIVTSAGAIPPLVRLLGSESAAVQQRACGALRNLCCSGSADQGSGPVAVAVPALVRLLDSSSASVQEMAAGALMNIFLQSAAQGVDAVSPAAIPALVRLLGSASDAVQEHAAGAVRNISFNAASCPLLVSAGAIPALEQLMGSKSAAVLEQAEAALGNIHYNPVGN